MDFNVPNFNGMDYESLLAFWATHQRGRGYKEFFPHGGKGSKRVTNDLANYAANKATAMKLRESGEIQRALVYESIAENIYKSFPSVVKW